MAIRCFSYHTQNFYIYQWQVLMIFSHACFINISLTLKLLLPGICVRLHLQFAFLCIVYVILLRCSSSSIWFSQVSPRTKGRGNFLIGAIILSSYEGSSGITSKYHGLARGLFCRHKMAHFLPLRVRPLDASFFHLPETPDQSQLDKYMYSTSIEPHNKTGKVQPLVRGIQWFSWCSGCKPKQGLMKAILCLDL